VAAAPLTRRRLAVVALVAALQLSAPALADHNQQHGVGDALRHPRTEQFVTDESLRSHGPEGVRISYLPYQGAGWTISLWPRGAAAAGKVVLRWDDRHGFNFGWFRLDLSRVGYDRLVARIDAALARGEPARGLSFCPEGDVFLAERRRAGRTSWVQQTCGGDMSTAIVEILVSAFPKQLCPWSPFAQDLHACKTMESDVRDLSQPLDEPPGSTPPAVAVPSP
jgi:hypothetical protein